MSFPDWNLQLFIDSKYFVPCTRLGCLPLHPCLSIVPPCQCQGGIDSNTTDFIHIQPPVWTLTLTPRTMMTKSPPRSHNLNLYLCDMKTQIWSSRSEISPIRERNYTGCRTASPLSCYVSMFHIGHTLCGH